MSDSKLDPALCRKLANEIQSDLDSGPEVNPYEITWGAASVIAEQLTAAAEMSAELDKLHIAQRADAERVRSVVAGVLGNTLARERQTWTEEQRAALIDAIADRVADELATAAPASAPVLSAEERDVLLHMRKSIQYSGEFTALLDRLLGGGR